jgi:hypothetical protein
MGYDLVFDAKRIRVMYRRFMMAGYTREQAGNLIAKLMGLEVSKKGWTVRELQYIDFIRRTKK